MAKLIFNEDLTEYRTLEMMEGAKILKLLEQDKGYGTDRIGIICNIYFRLRRDGNFC